MLCDGFATRGIVFHEGVAIFVFLSVERNRGTQKLSGSSRSVGHRSLEQVVLHPTAFHQKDHSRARRVTHRRQLWQTACSRAGPCVGGYDALIRSARAWMRAICDLRPLSPFPLSLFPARNKLWTSRQSTHTRQTTPWQRTPRHPRKSLAQHNDPAKNCSANAWLIRGRCLFVCTLVVGVLSPMKFPLLLFVWFSCCWCVPSLLLLVCPTFSFVVRVCSLPPRGSLCAPFHLAVLCVPPFRFSSLLSPRLFYECPLLPLPSPCLSSRSLSPSCCLSVFPLSFLLFECVPSLLLLFECVPSLLPVV